ncbi:MAG: polysaccharide deacetylase family protein [Oscillospiraceae bacterium]|nr:polysaccharide deacetylase family protein [Oscillospiraceae bacterium]
MKKAGRTKEKTAFRGGVLVMNRRWLAIAAGFAAAVAVFCAVCSPRVVGAAATARRLPIYCVARDDKACSLTFDAAWGNEDTQQLIDILARYKVKATFFVVGDWVEKYPESVKALHDAGHEVMNHSDDHAHFTQLSAEGVVANINACSDKIEAVTGVRPTLFRAPYGEYDDKVIAAVDGMGVKTIQWDVDSLDWKDLSASEIQNRVLPKVQKGSIVLFHNAAKHTPEALPGIIEGLIAEGYSIVPVSQLLLTGEYTINHEGRQMPAGRT